MAKRRKNGKGSGSGRVFLHTTSLLNFIYFHAKHYPQKSFRNVWFSNNLNVSWYVNIHHLSKFHLSKQPSPHKFIISVQVQKGRRKERIIETKLWRSIIRMKLYCVRSTLYQARWVHRKLLNVLTLKKKIPWNSQRILKISTRSHWWVREIW